jgi:hypothetical protein
MERRFGLDGEKVFSPAYALLLSACFWTVRRTVVLTPVASIARKRVFLRRSRRCHNLSTNQ